MERVEHHVANHLQGVRNQVKTTNLGAAPILVAFFFCFGIIFWGFNLVASFFWFHHFVFLKKRFLLNVVVFDLIGFSRVERI